MIDTPSVRPLDLQPVFHQGQRMWLLRDPIGLDDNQLLFPPLLAHMLRYLDGAHSVAAIQADLSRDAGYEVPLGPIHEAIDALDSACLLDNERSAAAQTALLADYRSQAFRPPFLAGRGYPADPQELLQRFDTYADGDSLDDGFTWHGRGVVSPHIDYQRGGPVYAQVWRRSAAAVLDAELVVILGTDHYGPSQTITLTHVPYATPFGVLPIDNTVTDALAEAAGGHTAAFANELYHCREHSIELSAVWLHSAFARAGQAPCPMIPMLVGSFYAFVQNGSSPSTDKKFNGFIEALRQLAATRRVLFVSSVDLSHVGPAFGDSFVMDAERRLALANEDHALMADILNGAADDFYSRVAQVGDRNHICGLAPLYVMSSCLGATTGTSIDYRQCPADSEDHSLVSICGLLVD